MAFSGIFGFDISKWQGQTDFARMSAYGARFLILRASYGSLRDERFDTYARDCEPYYPRIGVYHYYYPGISPSVQARTLLAAIEPYKQRIARVWLDMEYLEAQGYTSPLNWLELRDAVKNAGYRVGWYTRATWWDGRVGAYAADFATDPCWAAQYNSSLTLIPKGWNKAMIWQKGTPAIGVQAGVSSLEIDYNLWNDEYNINDEFGGGITPPVTGGSMKYKVTPYGSYDLRIRAPHPDAHILGSAVGTIANGTSGEADGKYVYTADKYVGGVLRAKAGDTWYHIVSPVEGWAAEIHLGTRYASVQEIATQTTTRKVMITVEEDGWKPASVEIVQEKA